MKRKRIIIDFGRLSTPYCGLGEVSLNYAQSLKNLQNDNFEFTYIVPHALLPAFNEQTGGQVTTITPKYFGLTRCLYYISRQKNLLCKLPRFDLYHYLHFNSPWGPSPSFRKKGQHFLLTVHDFHAMGNREGSRLKEKMRTVDRITFVSDFTCKQYQNFTNFPEKPTRVIKNGVPAPPLPVKKENFCKLQQKHGPFLFALGGGAMRRKNIHSLLGMLKKCQDFTELKTLKLLIAGEIKGGNRTKLDRKINAMKLDHQIIILGKISKEEKFRLMRSCRAFVFPSLQEGFGLPIIEAMHCGKPVFCSDKTSLPEVSGDMAYYWKDFEPEYMATVLKEGLEDYDSAIEEKSRALRQHAKNFDQDKNTSAYLRLYSEILAIK